MTYIFVSQIHTLGLPWWCSGKEYTCRRHRLDPWVREDSLEKEMATHSSILTWEIPWTEELGRLQSTGPQELDMTEQ